MKPEDARSLLQEATAKVNWLNFLVVMESLTKYDWGRYDNNYWRPDFNQLLHDKDWLAKNAGKLAEAIEVLYESRNDAKKTQGNDGS